MPLEDDDVVVRAGRGSVAPPLSPFHGSDMATDTHGGTESEKIHYRSSSAISSGNQRMDDVQENPLSTHRLSTDLGLPIKVPPSERRGLFGRFALVAEVVNPKTYSRTIKWYITVVVAAGAMLSPLGTSIFFRE